MQEENKRGVRPLRKPGVNGGEESKFKCNVGSRKKCFMKCVGFYTYQFLLSKIKVASFRARTFLM